MAVMTQAPAAAAENAGAVPLGSRATEARASEALAPEVEAEEEAGGWLLLLATFIIMCLSKVPWERLRISTRSWMVAVSPQLSNAIGTVGKQLLPIKSQSPPIMAAENCAHPQEQRLRGGNGHKSWVSCRLCHSRWEVVNQVPPATRTPLPPLAPGTISSCGHFKWHEELGWVSVSEIVEPGVYAGPLRDDSGGSMDGQRPFFMEDMKATGSGLPPLCKCEHPSIRRKVEKIGITKGQLFFTCTTGTCKFLMWDPDDRQRVLNKLKPETSSSSSLRGPEQARGGGKGGDKGAGEATAK
jgi:hypothetical protein